MAYATQNRFGTIEANPGVVSEGFLLADGERIFKHTLFGVRASDGKAVKITDANKNALSVIMYADEQLAEDQFNARVRAGSGLGTTVHGIFDLTVHLNSDGAIAAGAEGSDVYLVDDNTVTLTPNADPTLTPYVGKLKKVFSEQYNIVGVYVPGLVRS